MAKITVCGDAVVVTSALKLEEIRLVQKYRPEALTLKGGEDGKEPIFRIAATSCGCGSINKNGAEFTSESHDDGKLAQLTVICKTDGDIKEFIVDEIGSLISNLNKLEGTLGTVIAEIRSERQAVMDSITVA